MMTLRPEPVTSKFRSHYYNDIHPIYFNSNLYYSNSSSAGSTSSLTSILHRNNHDKFDINVNTNSLESLPLDYNNFNSKIPQESLENWKAVESNFTINKQNLKSRKHNGIIREIINSKDNIGLKSHNEYRNQKHRNERSCKRIIARKPDYPGSRIALVNYPHILNDKQLSKTVVKSKNKTRNNDPKNETHKRKVKELGSASKPLDNDSSKTPTVASIINRKSNMDEIIDNDDSARHQSEKSENNYSLCDFTSVSEQLGDQEQSPISKKVTDVNNPSEMNETGSFTSNQESDITDTEFVNGKQLPQRMLTAWEDWFLRKEKEERKRLKKERLNMVREEEKRKEDEMNKEKRRNMCQKKINDWLNNKEQERLNAIAKKKEEKQKTEEKIIKKEDVLKKSSEKYVAWKLKKLQLEKEEKRQEREKSEKLEAEKMIKQAKAKNAFNQWLQEHRDHHLPVSYSYGISDGKLTSYYDKTSNPPPSYFNPKPWIPIFEIK